MKFEAKLHLALAIIILLIIISLIVVFHYAFPNLAITGLASKESNQKNPDSIKIATFAVCDEIGNQTFCKDKIFASCNKTPIEVNSTEFYCDGKRYKISNLTLGEAYMPEDWQDARNNSFVTAWAISE